MLVLGLAAAYGAYRLWLRYQDSGGTLQILAAGLLGLLAVLIATAFALNIAAALGIA